MHSYSNSEKNNLLESYYVDNKTFLTVIIISSALILATAILIVILLTTSTNVLYENEEILRGYILTNAITAKYRVDEANRPVLLYNDKYTYLIHTIRVDGEKINEVKNEIDIFNNKLEVSPNQKDEETEIMLDILRSLKEKNIDIYEGLNKNQIEFLSEMMNESDNNNTLFFIKNSFFSFS